MLAKYDVTLGDKKGQGRVESLFPLVYNSPIHIFKKI